MKNRMKQQSSETVPLLTVSILSCGLYMGMGAKTRWVLSAQVWAI